MPSEQFFSQFGLRAQIGGDGRRSHPRCGRFHTTKTQSRHAERTKIPAPRKGQPATGQWVVAAKSIDRRQIPSARADLGWAIVNSSARRAILRRSLVEDGPVSPHALCKFGRIDIADP
jgi:hypothetical protein